MEVKWSGHGVYLAKIKKASYYTKDWKYNLDVIKLNQQNDSHEQG